MGGARSGPPLSLTVTSLGIAREVTAMYRLIIILILYAFSAAPMAAQQRKPDRDYYELVGPVHTIRTETAKIEMKSGQIKEKQRKLSSIEKYNVKGDLIDRAYTDAINGTINFYLQPASLLPLHTYTGTINGTINKSVFRHDSKGNYIEEIYIGNWDPDQRGYTYTIDRSGRVVQMDGVLRIRYECKFDGEGNRVESIGNYENVFELKVRDRYEKGRVVERMEYENDQLSYRQVYVRDDRGMVTEQIEYKPNGTVSGRETYSYEVDARGNWVKRIKSKWVTREGKTYFEPEEVDYRMIRYY